MSLIRKILKEIRQSEFWKEFCKSTNIKGYYENWYNQLLLEDKNEIEEWNSIIDFVDEYNCFLYCKVVDKYKEKGKEDGTFDLERIKWIENKLKNIDK